MNDSNDLDPGARYRGPLPRQAQRVVEEGKTLLKEANGLGKS